MFERNFRGEKAIRREIKKEYDTRRPPEKEMIFGIRAIMEAIDAGKTLDKILLRRDMTSTIGKELLQKLQGTNDEEEFRKEQKQESETVREDDNHDL